MRNRGRIPIKLVISLSLIGLCVSITGLTENASGRLSQKHSISINKAVAKSNGGATSTGRPNSTNRSGRATNVSDKKSTSHSGGASPQDKSTRPQKATSAQHGGTSSQNVRVKRRRRSSKSSLHISKREPLPRRIVAKKFSVSSNVLSDTRPSTRFSFRIDGPSSKVQASISIAATSHRGSRTQVNLGWKRTGVTHSFNWRPKIARLRPGKYTIELRAYDPRRRLGLHRSGRHSGRQSIKVSGHRSPHPSKRSRATSRSRKRSAHHSSQVSPPTPGTGIPLNTPQPPASPFSQPLLQTGLPGVFPIRGPYQYGDPIGVKRPGNRLHEGQDIAAPPGTPIVSPRAGTVIWRKFQPNGAGYYLVVRAEEGRDYVFMHLKRRSIVVKVGDTVSAGQVLGAVGSTGHSTAPHLHLEIWPNGWYSTPKSKPADPLGDLMFWEGK